MSKIVLLIPHYNSSQELEKTIASVSESFPIDILIIDDGSVDKPNLSRIKSTYHNNGTIIIKEFSVNQGIEKALNYGLEYIKNKNYKYIGRLDSGDRVLKDKFKKQIDYLDQNSDVFLLGTWGNITDKKGNHLYYLKHPVKYSEIKKRMYYNNCFIHPSVVFRKDVLSSIGYYPENRKSAEDFAYFFNIIKKHKAENLPEILIDYVIAENSISSIKRKQQIKNRIRTILDHFYFGFYPIIGLFRNCILLFTSRELILKIKLFLKLEK